MRPASPPRTWPAKAARVGESLPLERWHPAVVARVQCEPRAARWAIALSGGADSVALLLALWTHFPQRRARMLVLHFNHRLRGRASAADAAFCQRLCRALGVEISVGEWKEARPQASEAAARAARLAFFAAEMRRVRAKCLWLAHQQDDVAETMLMRLARGSGTGGLAAPRPVQPQADGRVHLRPLLAFGKPELVEALRAAGATWREDATNATDLHFRNRVRRTLLPAWERASGRDVRAAVALSRERLQEDDDALEAWLERLAPLDRRRARLDLGKLADCPTALWRRALQRWLLAARVETDLSRAGFEQLLTAVRRGRPTRFSLGTGSFAVVRRGMLLIERA